MKIERIIVGPIQTICYLLVSNKNNCIIVDPGGDHQKIIERIEQKKILPKMILLTHGHYDHVEVVNQIKDRYNIKVYLHKNDEEMQKNYFWDKYLGRQFNSPVIDGYLFDGQEIRLDELTLKVIETPGHSPGSVSFIVNKDVFSGDTLFADGGIGRTDLWRSSQADIVNSIKNKLFILDEDYKVYPGHGNSTTIGDEKRLHGFFQKGHGN